LATLSISRFSCAKEFDGAWLNIIVLKKNDNLLSNTDFSEIFLPFASSHQGNNINILLNAGQSLSLKALYKSSLFEDLQIDSRCIN
jgi:hypothetical protein